MIYQNPQFIDSNSWNFDLENSSPCIDSGSPDLIDSDGTVSDIGAIIYNNCINSGDLNNDGIINVLDVTLGICTILDPNNTDCLIECNLDMNNDNQNNVIDIVLIINIIINL